MGLIGRQDFENLLCFSPKETNFWGLPEITGISSIPKNARFVNSEFARREKDYGAWVMFYEYDWKFIKMWEQPKRQAKWLSNFQGAITPNFSVYMDTPLAVQLYSIYRNRWCGAYWESLGIPVIPNVACGDDRTYNFAFEGLPKNAVLSINNMGCMKDEECRSWCYKKVDETMKRLSPRLLLIYGAKMTGLDGYPIQYINQRCVNNG